MNLPTWINKALFQLSLSTYLNEDYLQILEFSCKPAIAVGENYTTNIIRVIITFVRNQNAK